MLALEYVSGGSLRDYLRKKSNKKVPEAEAKVYFGQIVGAVRYLHNKHIYHRDLKLENILLDYKKDIKIIDFGFSVECEPEDQLDAFWGTTPYMAPEMVQKEKYWGHQIDVWAIGVITYSMLAGFMPFNGKTEEDLFKKIWCGQYRNPTGISYDCKRLLSNILHLDSMKRPSVADLFYDPWNAHYFKNKSNTKRKTQNNSMQRLIKNFIQRQQDNNWFMLTEKKKIQRRKLV